MKHETLENIRALWGAELYYLFYNTDMALAAVALGCNLGRDHSFEIHTAAIGRILYI